VVPRPLGLALLLGVWASSGCGQALPPHGRQLLLRSYDACRQAEYSEVVRHTDRFLREFRRGPRQDEALYLRGYAYAKLVEPTKAQADLRQAFNRSSHSELKAKASLALAELALEAADAATAEQWYRASLSLEDRRGPADRAYFQLGVLLQQQGRWHEADIQFSRLVFFFEREAVARLARDRMQCRAWTIQAGCFEDRVRAEGLAARLTREGLAASAAPVLTAGRLVYAVQVGRHAMYEQARAELAGVARHAEGAVVAATR